MIVNAITREYDTFDVILDRPTHAIVTQIDPQINLTLLESVYIFDQVKDVGNTSLANGDIDFISKFTPESFEGPDDENTVRLGQRVQMKSFDPPLSTKKGIVIEKSDDGSDIVVVVLGDDGLYIVSKNGNIISHV